MTNQRVVVTGLGIICSLGNNKFEVIKAMKEKKTGIDIVQKFSTENFISSLAGEVENFQNISSLTDEEKKSYSLCTQYAIAATTEALNDAGIDSSIIHNENIGVAFGSCNGGIDSIEYQGKVENFDTEELKLYPFYQQADSLAKYFGFKGPINTINTACAASGNAIGFAVDMIVNGYADIMIAGGSDVLSKAVYAGFNSLKALNPEFCAPYSKKFGLNLGEGAAFLILEPLERAIKRNAHIYSEICGYSLSNDAYHITAPDPEGKGIHLAVKKAIEQSGIDKNQIKYINTHGTGTKANDSAELRGLRSYFGEELFSKIPISSTKSYFGHNLGAAAAIEYVTTLLAFQEGFFPSNLHLSEIREGCEDANLIIGNNNDQIPDYFLCNNSAFGGHNASLVSRFWDVKNDRLPKTEKQNNKVCIVGIGLINNDNQFTDYISREIFNKEEELIKFNNLKDYDKNLYERRMNTLTQLSLAAADLALKDSGLNPDNQDIGLIYGTSRGSLESVSKYLSGIIQKGYEHASSIYFPDLVLNSTAGKIANKFNISGFSSSLSTGGTEGLMSTLYGYEMIKKGIQSFCLVGAGDEASGFGEEINSTLGFDNNLYPITEGGTFLILADLDKAKEKKMKIYAEIKGFGLGSEVSNENSVENPIVVSIERALLNSQLSKDTLDFIIYSTPPREKDKREMEDVINQYFGDSTIKVSCLDNLIGYGESRGSLNNLSMASDLIYHKEAYKENNAILDKFGSDFNQGIIIGTSLNGNCIASIIGKSK